MIDTANGVSLDQFFEICVEEARDLGIKYGSEKELKEKIMEHFGIHPKDKWPTIITDKCYEDVLAILQN